MHYFGQRSISLLRGFQISCYLFELDVPIFHFMRVFDRLIKLFFLTTLNKQANFPSVEDKVFYRNSKLRKNRGSKKFSLLGGNDSGQEGKSIFLFLNE